VIDEAIDVAIVGAGPLGIELAVAFRQMGITYIQFDKGQVGQTIFHYPPETRFFSSNDKIGIAGIPIQTVDQQKCSREQYLAYIRSVVLKYQLNVNAFEEVVSIKKDTDTKFTLSTQSSIGLRTYRVKYVVLATGGLGQSRLLGVDGEGLPHVSTVLEDPHLYFQRNVVIVGGKNSAVEAALRCYHAGAYATVIVRKSEFDAHDVKYWLLPELNNRIKKGEIHCFFDSEVISISNRHVVINTKNEDATFSVDAEFVIKAIGFKSELELFQQLSISCDEENGCPQYHKETMETSCDNVFVLGTAIAGTQKRFRVYIENTHHHVKKIVDSICQRLHVEAQHPSWLDRLPQSETIIKQFLEE
jgi:bacillithiol disulfide reductase